MAPCGSLEDPARWRLGWWVWAVGALLVVAAVVAGPRRATRRRWWTWLLLPVWLVVLAVVALPVSWATSVQGAAALVLLGVLPWGRRGR